MKKEITIIFVVSMFSSEIGTKERQIELTEQYISKMECGDLNSEFDIRLGF